MKRGKKWKIWCSSGDLGPEWKGFKGDRRSAESDGCDSSTAIADAYTAAVATVVRAPPKNFRVVREEWAAIRIQTAFRGFLVIGSLSLSFFLAFLVCLIAEKICVWLLRKCGESE